MIKYKNILAKGFCVGSSMLIPGVSGGSMAMILGIYDQLILAVSDFFADTKKNALFLAIFCLGSVIGIVLFAKPLLFLLNKFPMPVTYFFLGAVCGGIPMILKKAQIKKINKDSLIYPLLGFLLVIALTMLPENIFTVDMGNKLWSFFILTLGGMIVAWALVFPGISVSYMLLIMGIYDYTIKAINTWQWSYLLPMFLGGVIGTFITAKLLGKALVKYPTPTFLLILGFILGSIPDIFPGIPLGGNIVFCILTFISGAIIIYKLSVFDK
ncbi:MAG: DUF368 domain-containing protein [Clostridiales bacterium]